MHSGTRLASTTKVSLWICSCCGVFISVYVGAGNSLFVNEDVIAGLPDWANGSTFALQAKMGQAQLAVFATLDQGGQRACQDHMEQAMLADRFNLKMHRQPRQVQAYDLIVGKGGLKLRERRWARPHGASRRVRPGTAPNWSFR